MVYIVDVFGDNTIIEAENITFSAVYDDDNICTLGSKSSVLSRDGSDYIYDFGSYASIDAGDGNDSIYN